MISKERIKQIENELSEGFSSESVSDLLEYIEQQEKQLEKLNFQQMLACRIVAAIAHKVGLDGNTFSGDPAEIIDVIEKQKFLYERQCNISDKLEEKLNNILHQAVSVIHFEDGSDYKKALYSIVEIADGKEAKDLLFSNSAEAFKKYCEE